MSDQNDEQPEVGAGTLFDYLQAARALPPVVEATLDSAEVDVAEVETTDAVDAGSALNLSTELPLEASASEYDDPPAAEVAATSAAEIGTRERSLRSCRA